MFQVFLVVQIIITLVLVGLILIQRNDSDGLGSMGGGGGGNAFMTGRGQANLLTRSTAIFASLFMLNCLWLAIMAGGLHNSRNLADAIVDGKDTTVNVPLAEDAKDEMSTVPAATEETAPAQAPADETAPATPAEPATAVTPEAAPAAQAPAPAESAGSDADNAQPVVPTP